MSYSINTHCIVSKGNIFVSMEDGHCSVPSEAEATEDYFPELNSVSDHYYAQWTNSKSFREEVKNFDLSSLIDGNKTKKAFYEDKIDDTSANFLLSEYEYEETITSILKESEITGILKTAIKFRSRVGDFKYNLKKGLFEGIWKYDQSRLDIRDLIESATIGKGLVKKDISKEDILNLL